MYVCMHVCVHAWVCMWVCTHMHARVHVPMYIHMCVPAPMQGGTGGIAGQDAAAGGAAAGRGLRPQLCVPPSLPGPSPPADPDPAGDAGQKAQSPPARSPIACAFTPGARGSRRVPCSRRGSFPAALVSGQPGAASDAPCAQMDTSFCSPASLLLRDTCDHPRPGSARQQLILLSSQIPLLFALGGRKPFHRRCYLGNAE